MFDIVEKFENQIAEFYDSPYAVAVDCCTHAIELSLIHTGVKSTTIPTNTYISIPFTLDKLKIQWTFEEKPWDGYYYLSNTNIIDAAVHWKQNGYIPGTFMCLSFQFKKHLSLGRGGAILLDNHSDYIALKKLSYDGRLPNIPWMEQNIQSIGYHYYMTPETAELGIEKLKEVKHLESKKWSHLDYPYLPNMSVFKNAQH